MKQNGPSGKHKNGVARKSTKHEFTRLNDRHPLVKRCSFTQVALKQLKRAGMNFEKGKPLFLPDGRWIIETKGNGSSLVMKELLCSFD